MNGDARSGLARATRQLMDAVVRTEANDADIAAATRKVESATAGLAQELRPTMRRSSNYDVDGGWWHTNPVVGDHNPYAPPMQIRVLDDGSVEGVVTMQPIHEGPPGSVHGGLVATLLDQVLGHANHAAGVAGMTVELTVRYRKPTPYGQPLTLLARHDGTDGRRVCASGEILFDGEVTAEATGVFLQPSPANLERMAAIIAASDGQDH